MESGLIENACQRVSSDRNIVLIGMPGCGKTTVGRLLARETGRPFIGIDEQLTGRFGISIADFFARYGEAAFRDEETKLIASLRDMSGCVIATGGGSVLRAENVRNLRAGGLLILLDRPLPLLEVSDERPLSRTRKDLEVLYAARRSLYRQAADLIIDNSGSPDEAVRAIREAVL
ncbi:MAG: shikimate kinase [Lachnospiraceae bacterium]|nr:shikimate kinase [Lachnospiraceae bacterium]